MQEYEQHWLNYGWNQGWSWDRIHEHIIMLEALLELHEAIGRYNVDHSRHLDVLGSSKAYLELCKNYEAKYDDLPISKWFEGIL